MIIFDFKQISRAVDFLNSSKEQIHAVEIDASPYLLRIERQSPWYYGYIVFFINTKTKEYRKCFADYDLARSEIILDTFVRKAMASMEHNG